MLACLSIGSCRADHAITLLAGASTIAARPSSSISGRKIAQTRRLPNRVIAVALQVGAVCAGPLDFYFPNEGESVKLRGFVSNVGR